MRADQTYLLGVANAFSAAGIEKVAVSRWLASQFGLGVGKAIDEASEEVQKLREVPKEKGEGDKKEDSPPKPPKEPKKPKAPAIPKLDDDIVDTPEEVEREVQKVLKELGVSE